MRAAVLLVLLTSIAGPAFGSVLATKEACLEEAFPGATLERSRSFLSEAEAASVGETAGTPLPSRAVIAWRALDGANLLGTAYLERHRVRTLPESILVLVSPAGEVLRIDVLTFDEPRDYLPPERWLGQFEGRPLGNDLRLKRGIRGLSGATLSARAVTDAVRRVLAVHEVLAKRVPSRRAGQ